MSDDNKPKLTTIGSNLVKAVGRWSEDLAKGKTEEKKPVVEQPASDTPPMLTADPFAVLDNLGYKDKPSQITYGTLRAIMHKMIPAQAIKVTRQNRISTFCRPKSSMFKPGFQVRLKDPTQTMRSADKKEVERLEDFLLNTGATHNFSADSFETFVRKIVADSLTFDAATFKIDYSRKGFPIRFQAADAATIRLADTPGISYTDDPNHIHTVQVYNNVVIAEYKPHEMAFCVRNPTTDIGMYGYGTSELEMLTRVITSWLHSFDYNSRFFQQGTVAKGFMHLKGPINRRQIEGFERQWHNLLSGVKSAWRVPILNTQDDIQWVNMTQSNRDMEFAQWIDFLIKIACSCYQIDPIEINFIYGNTGQTSSLNAGSNEEKYKESRDKGLVPLLNHIENWINKYLIRPMNPDFVFEFVGYEGHTKDGLATLNKERVSTTHTINELRAEQDLEPIDGGDVILNPTFLQAIQMHDGRYEGSNDGEVSDVNADGRKEGTTKPFTFNAKDFAALMGEESDIDDEPDFGDDTEKSLSKSIDLEWDF